MPFFAATLPSEKKRKKERKGEGGGKDRKWCTDNPQLVLLISSRKTAC